MVSRCALILASCLLMAGSVAAEEPTTEKKEQQTAADAGGDARLVALLEPIREQHDLPALAGAIVTPDGVQAVGAVGQRVYGKGPAVTADDEFHLGSCTKSMTATLLATFVEAGAIGWETTLAEALPELADAMDPAYRAVTLEQLLAHRSGFSGETAAPGMSLLAMWTSDDPLRVQREEYTRRVLAEPPVHPPGTEFQYSNRNYIVAGAIAERLGDAPWEELMRRRIFDPLGMETAGFGPMAAPGKTDQPWPHKVVLRLKLPIQSGPSADNPPLVGPAGTVHASLGDWGKYIACHLRAGRGQPALLKPETFARLHTPPAGQDYAFGWGFAERDWGGGTVLSHAGSNTINFAVVWMAPRRDFAVLAATNQGGDAAAQGCDDASAALIRHYLEEKDR